MNKRILATLLLGTLSLFASTDLLAQATRTWVSGVGDDVNPCSRTAPCKTFAGAISKTATGGEISVLDNGPYGAVTITKAITINGDNQLGTILASSVNGIIVNAPAGSVVIIRGISINGAGSNTSATGLNAIRFIAGAELHVENVTIYGFTQAGVDFNPSGASSLFMNNVSIKNTANAVWLHPGAAGSATASLNRVSMDGNGGGMRLDDGSIAVVRDSQATGNDTHGFAALSVSRRADLSLENSVASNNLGTGLFASGAQGVVRMSNVMVTRNNAGIQATGGGAIVSFGNNRVNSNNANNGPASSTPGQM